MQYNFCTQPPISNGAGPGCERKEKAWCWVAHKGVNKCWLGCPEGLSTMKKNGWMQKKSQGLFSRWQNRFLLHQAGTLTLKHDPNESRCRLFDIISAKQGPAETVLIVHCKDGRTLSLKAASEAERDEWLMAFLEHDAPVPQRVASPPHPALVNEIPSPTEVEQASARGEVAIISQAPTELGQEQKSSRGQTPSASDSPMVSAEESGRTESAHQHPIEPAVSLLSRKGREFKTQTYFAGQYTGEFLNGERHGMGHFEYTNGNLYTGSWEKDKKCEFGKLRWTNNDIFSGEWKDNKMWGYGLFQYSNGNAYMGNFVADNKEGQGKFNWSNGDTYEGEWVADEMCGHGTTRYTNGNVYIGTCRSNVKHGMGRMEWASGDTFDGQWANGLIHGKGVFTYSDGGKYEGDWEQDQRHGQGTMTHANGDVYTGPWREDKRHGSGTCQYANSDAFVGNFADNMREGWGVYTAAALRMLGPDGTVREMKGDQYSGNWQRDQKSGYGKFVWSDGDVYDGSWDQDLRSGEGTCVYANGDRYTGQWKEDMRHGWGRLVWADGNMYEGGWRNDNISPGTKGLVPSSAPTRQASVGHSPQQRPAQVNGAVPGLQENADSSRGRPGAGAGGAGGLMDNDIGLQVSDLAADIASIASGSWLDNLAGSGTRSRPPERRGASPTGGRKPENKLLLF